MYDPANNPFRSHALWACLAVAAVAGFLCLVLPPYLTTQTHRQGIYTTTLISWFATAASNLEFKISAGLLFLLGAALGSVQPKRAWMIGSAAVSLFLAVHTVNVAHDLSVDKTSHNLLPLEYVMFGVMVFPVIAGAKVGEWVRRQLVEAR